MRLKLWDYQSCLACTMENVYSGFLEKQHFNRNFSWEYCLKFSLLIIWCFYICSNDFFHSPKHAISVYLYWRNDLGNIMQHNLICEHSNYNIFLGIHIPFSIYDKTTPHSLKNKTIINTLVFLRGYIVLVFSASFCSFIVTPSPVLFIV